MSRRELEEHAHVLLDKALGRRRVLGRAAEGRPLNRPPHRVLAPHRGLVEAHVAAAVHRALEARQLVQRPHQEVDEPLPALEGVRAGLALPERLVEGEVDVVVAAGVVVERKSHEGEVPGRREGSNARKDDANTAQSNDTTTHHATAGNRLPHARKHAKIGVRPRTSHTRPTQASAQRTDDVSEHADR